MRAVNLLPQQTSSSTLRFDRSIAVAMAITLVVAAAVAGGFFIEKAHASTARQQMTTAQAELARAIAAQTKANPSGHTQLQIPVVLSQQEPWHLALDTALSTRMAWDTLLSQLQYAVPARLDLTTVNLASPVGGAAPTGTGGGTITIDGTAYSYHDVAVFMSTLGRVPKISNVSLASSTASNTGVVTFSITAQAALPAGLMPVAAPTATTTTSTTGGQG